MTQKNSFQIPNDSLRNKIVINYIHTYIKM